MSAYAQGLAEVEELIEKATADHLSGPEWHLNLMICDAVNANNAISDDVVHILQRKLQSGSPRVALLALVVVETLVKNGSAAFHTQVASRTFLQEIAAMTDGSLGFDVQNKALELIKQWADAFAGSNLTAFQDTYRMLKIQGVAFPEIEHDAPVFTPPTSPRMNTLIEGGVMGKLDERTFEECLNVNDHLVKALDELRTPGVGAEAQAAVQEDLISFDSPKRKPVPEPQPDLLGGMESLSLDNSSASSTSRPQVDTSSDGMEERFL
ncbi:hypothetical protein ATCC90586_002417 [Pythium insidiosum]|nr:hypothetical protein ATCC90586_002417 [Pythium insidiosum]